MLEGTTSRDEEPNNCPLAPALDSPNIHHYIIGAQSAGPADSVANPFRGESFSNSGHLP